MTARPRKGKKRTANYRLASNRSYTTVQGSRFTGLDPHLFVTLKYYSTHNTGTLTTGTASNQIYNLNSVFDPDRTGAGHQPYLFDYFATAYNRYRVRKVRWKIEFAGSTGTTFGLVLPSNGLIQTAITTTATFEQASELPFARSHLLSIQTPHVVVSGGISLNVLNGTSQVEYLADDRFEAQVSASPSEIMVLNLGILNGSASSIIQVFSVTLEYFVDFHDPIIQTQSFSRDRQAVIRYLKSIPSNPDEDALLCKVLDLHI